MNHCERCPLRKHGRPCPAHWDGCAATCSVIDVGHFRHEIVRASDPAVFRGRLAEALRSALSVSIVVISHNYGRYLAEALDSVLAQTVAPREVLVVDDSSDDDTAEVAARYVERGVRYLRVEHRHVYLSRKSGFEATSGDVLLFLDADNKLPPDYLARGLPLFADRRVGIVYADLQQFGDSTELRSFPEFDAALLERQNYIDACALVTRQALVISRALDAPAGEQSHADWRLWRRVVDAGFVARKQPVPCLYRIHPGQMIRSAPADYFERAGLADETITLFVPLSGRTRAWNEYLRPWLDGQTWPRAQTRLVLADASYGDEFHAMARRWAFESDYPNVNLYREIVGTSGLADLPRANQVGHTEAVNNACRRIYARMARELGTAYVLVIEDDHQPPLDVAERLLRSMDERTAAVSGLYRNRERGEFVAFGGDQPIGPVDSGPAIEITGSGFGCLLLRRSALIGETFARRPGEEVFYDNAFAYRTRARGFRWKLDRSIQVEHWGARPIRPRPVASELEVLEIVAKCSFARVCNCIYRGNVECQPGGKRPGEKLPPAVCRECLASSVKLVTVPDRAPASPPAPAPHRGVP